MVLKASKEESRETWEFGTVDLIQGRVQKRLPKEMIFDWTSKGDLEV